MTHDAIISRYYHRLNRVEQWLTSSMSWIFPHSSVTAFVFLRTSSQLSWIHVIWWQLYDAATRRQRYADARSHIISCKLPSPYLLLVRKPQSVSRNVSKTFNCLLYIAHVLPACNTDKTWLKQPTLRVTSCRSTSCYAPYHTTGLHRTGQKQTELAKSRVSN